jgi:ElaB/YqjD/DUF883 family membrane-anchored ribosome-binding protein
MMGPTITKYDSGVNTDEKARGTERGELPAVLRDAGRHEIGNLLADVQDLLRHVARVADPEVALLRARVESRLAAAKGVLLDAGHQMQRRAKSADHFVRDQPWKIMSIAAAAGLAVGALIGRRKVARV